MIPTAEFDPASLTVWTSTASLNEPLDQLASGVAKAAMSGSNPESGLEGLAPGDPLRGRLQWFASSIWHEKRHFFDTCLTNYGARRFRHLIQLACNFIPFLSRAEKAGQPIWFPIEIYACPVKRRILGIPDPHADTLELATLAKKSKEFLSRLDAPVVYRGASFHIGAEAQMEGLAQCSQTLSVENAFGLADSFSATAEYVHRLTPSGPYRTIEQVSRWLGCSRKINDHIVLNPGFASALFFTALCGRYFGLGNGVPAGLVSPRHRLGLLLEEVGKNAGSFEMSDEAAMEIVDKIAKKLWGRTALEEVAFDIDAMESRLDLQTAPWLEPEYLDQVYSDYIQLRRSVLSEVIELGPSSVLPRAFPGHWRDSLQPWHVETFPNGSGDEKNGETVFGIDLNPPAAIQGLVPSRVVWGTLSDWTANPTFKSFRPARRQAWFHMLECHAPRARLMLNGRRHRRMIPPELERTISEISDLGVEIKYHPSFEWPANRGEDERNAEAVALAEFSGRTHFVCDITGEKIDPLDASVLTPWEFRRSPLRERFLKEVEIGQLYLARDWSDWVVRSDLLRSASGRALR